VLAGALTAAKLKIKVAHVEAGLRSYDRDMPEEINRIMADHVSDFLFAVSKIQEEILLAEGISKDKVHVLGNTVVDALYRAKDLNANRSLQAIHGDIIEGQYFLLTAHRPSNVDEKGPLSELIQLCQTVGRKYGCKIVWPIHPRSKARLEEFKIDTSDDFIFLEPQDYLNFILLMQKAKAILTDSGGLQEEACILKIPCITLRENTERPESIEAGANILVGRDTDKALRAMEYFDGRDFNWVNPFGDGKTGEEILNILCRD
jgi:UDP-N-acetylglucosamine 2-epimerase (non-hydrolysing)